MKGFETAFVRRTADATLLADLAATHEAFFEGDPGKARPRSIIRDSWLRVRRIGLSPALGGLPTSTPTCRASAPPSNRSAG